jgi:UDP:flavonoid glycosyltransferase YjiC (YdhE family)
MPAELALIEDSLELDHLFPRLRGLIQHGGPGTTHAAILHALPQVIVAPGPGQGTQAHLVSRAGLGKFLHLEEITLENLRTLVATVVSNPQFKTQAETYQAQFAAGSGIPGAADALETLC